MNAIQLLREQLQSAHETLEATMADVTDKTAHFTKIGKALPVGAAYAHAVLAEDIIVATMLAHTTPLSAENPETGVSEPMPPFDKWDQHEKWYQSVKVDLAKMREFAKKVYKAGDDYLASLKDEDLNQEVDLSGMGMGKKNLVFIINNFLILHTANLTGEISAAKGVQGLKGYPF